MPDPVDRINEAIALLREARSLINTAGTSRAVSLAKTKIDEAQMWAQRHLVDGGNDSA